jgi:hypothetical protein
MESAWVPSTDEWIKKVWCTYKMEYYLAIKNDIISFIGKWMETIMLSEISQVQKDK